MNGLCMVRYSGVYKRWEVELKTEVIDFEISLFKKPGAPTKITRKRDIVIEIRDVSKDLLYLHANLDQALLTAALSEDCRTLARFQFVRVVK